MNPETLFYADPGVATWNCYLDADYNYCEQEFLRFLSLDIYLDTVTALT